ncbi:MAG TPA: SH3 domain-containing protein, partial [Rhizomicrobium sp.]|nr:SH3 domain-containing protein [Rhizomicrobium sp.]
VATSRSLKVRATPSTKADVVVSLEKGATLVLLEQNGNWTHVEVPATGQQGWVFTANLAAKKEVSTSVKTDAAAVPVPKNPAPPAANPAPADQSPAAASPAANAAPAAPAVSQTPPENTPAPAAPSQ